MRVAALMNFAPRKAGSFEEWLIAVGRELSARGHTLTLYGRTPVQSDFLRRTDALGVAWRPAAALEVAPVRAVRELRAYDVLWVNMVQPRHPLALLAYAAAPAQVVYVDHTSGYRQRDEGLRARAARRLDGLVRLRVKRFVGVSHYVCARDERRYGLPTGGCACIHNGIALPRFAAKQRYTLDGPMTVACVANLIREKGVEYLVRAVAALDDDTRLIIVGDGPEEAALRALARGLRAEHRIELAGLSDEVPTLLARADVFVHPAIWEEAFGLTVIESMACGLPTIASGVGGIPEIIESGRNGLLVRPGDVEALREALASLAADEGLRARLGANARRSVSERFVLAESVRQHVDVIESAAPPSAPYATAIASISTRAPRGRPAA